MGTTLCISTVGGGQWVTSANIELTIPDGQQHCGISSRTWGTTTAGYYTQRETGVDLSCWLFSLRPPTMVWNQYLQNGSLLWGNISFDGRVNGGVVGIGIWS